MPLRMPGRWDNQEVRTEQHGLRACKDDFGIRLGREFGAVDDALSREVSFDAWRRRPLWEKLIGTVAWILERQQ